MRPFAVLCRAMLRCVRRAALARPVFLGLAALATVGGLQALQASPVAGAASPSQVPVAGAAGPARPPDATRIPSFIEAMVRIEVRAVDGATSNETLGTVRVGSGVLIRPGLVLTIGYLLLEAEQVELISSSGRRVPANVIASDRASGFGLVRSVLPLDGAPLPLGDSDRVEERQVLLTQAHGEAYATRLLVVSRRPFDGDWEYLLERPIFTFPAVNNWSGSALLTEDGQLVGIGSLIVGDAAGDGRVPGNLFVPVNLLKPIVEALLANGRRSGPAQAWFGIGTEAAHGHLIVSKVNRDGPAAAAGVRTGDIVLAVGEQPVSTRADFYRELWKLGPAGTEVDLRILQDGQVRQLKIRSIDHAEVLARPRGI